MNDKMKDAIKGYMNYLIIAVVCLVYTASAFVTMGKTGQTVSEILINTMLAFCVGVAVNHAAKAQGISVGLSDDKVKSAIERFEKTVEKLMPKIGKLDEWCRRENKKNYETQRRKILSNVGMTYESCFDESGIAIEPNITMYRREDIQTYGIQKWIRHNREMKSKERGYEKAVNLKLAELTAGELTSEGGSSNDPYKLGRSIHKYMTDTTIRDMASKLIMSVIFGYYTVEQVVNFSWGVLIWRILQVAIFLAMGSVQMDKSRIFVTGEYKGRIDEKYRHLRRFENDMIEKGLIEAVPEEVPAGKDEQQDESGYAQESEHAEDEKQMVGQGEEESRGGRILAPDEGTGKRKAG